MLPVKPRFFRIPTGLVIPARPRAPRRPVDLDIDCERGYAAGMEISGSSGLLRVAVTASLASLALGVALGFLIGRGGDHGRGDGTGEEFARGVKAAATTLPGRESIEGGGRDPANSGGHENAPSGGFGSEGGRNGASFGLAPGEDLILFLDRQLARLGAAGSGALGMRERMELGRVLLMLGEEELPAALELLTALENPSAQGSLFGALFGRWIEIDPAAALRQAEGIADARLRDMALSGALSGWAEQSPRAAWDYVLRTEPGVNQIPLINSVLSRIAELDPKEAAAMAQGLENTVVRGRALHMLANSWADSDPEAALEWLDALGDESMRRIIRPNVLSRMALQNPEAALVSALREGDARARGEGVSEVLSQWARQDPDAALAALDQLPGDMRLEDVSLMLGYALSGADPAQVSAYADRLPEGDARVTFLRSIIRGKASAGASEEAIAYLDTVAPGPGRNELYQTFAGAWARTDPFEASAWLDRLPGGAERDRAVLGFSYLVVDSDPDGALLWASSIEQPELRENQIRQLTRGWMRRDPAAAAAWIEGSEILPEKLRKELIRGVPQQ